MSEHSASSFVLLTSWPDGRRETHEIPHNGTVRIGPRDEPAATAVDLYSPTGTRIGAVIVHGAEQPEWLVAPATMVLPVEASSDGGNGTSEPVGALQAVSQGQPDELASVAAEGANVVQGTPEWFAEVMSELAERHDLRSVAGLENATFEAATIGTEYTYRAEACTSLARGYQSSADALAAIDSGDGDRWACAHERAGGHFQKALDAARMAEAAAA